MTLKKSDGEAQVILELWECGGPLYCHRSLVHSAPELVAPDKGPIYGLNRTKRWLEFFFFFFFFFAFKLRAYAKRNCSE